LKKMSFFTALLLVFCFLSGFQKQQKQEKPLEHEVEVELVIVEVFVTDKEGNFVDNLSRDDFEIFEDGKRVKIQYFAVVKPEKEIIREKVVKEIPEGEKPQPPQKMKLVILFDNFNTNQFFLQSHWPQIVEMFKALSDKVEETMIVELSPELGARVVQPFTSDQELLAEMVSKIKLDIWRGVDEISKRDLIEWIWTSGFFIKPEYVIDVIREEDRIIRRRRLSDSFSSFIAAVNHIRKFDGTKAVLIVSDGFHIEKDIKRGYSKNGGTYGEVTTDFVRLFDPFKLFGGKKILDQHEAFKKFLQLINEERLIFYALSPKGLKEYFSLTPAEIRAKMSEYDMEQWTKELYTIEEIAEETGGVYLRGAKKYESFIKELGRDLTHFYDISYTPPGKRKKEYHKIEVKVKRPGLTVRHRKGYSDFTERDLEKRNLASAFLSPSLFKDIDFSCKTDFIALRGGYLQFWIRLKIPLDQFRSNRDLGPPEKLPLLFGINEKTENKVHTGGRVLGIKEAVEKGDDILYRAFITSLVDLEPGEYETRLILRESGEKMGGWEASLEIPDMEKESPLRIINSICGFLQEEEKENTVPFSVSIGDGSLLLSKHRFYPFMENVFNKERNIALLLQTYSPKKVQDFAFQFSLERDENTTLNIDAEKIESFFDKELKVLSEVYLLDFQDVPQGEYQLRINSSEGNLERIVGVKIIS
jgi:VWFA-related protein